MHNDFIYKTRVYIDDTDFGGVMYHANYLKYFERARSEWAEEAGIGIEWQKKHDILLVVHSASLNYLKPARLFDAVEVVSRLSDIRRASITFEQYLRLATDPDKILCKGSIRIVCTNMDIRPQPLPESPFIESMRRQIQ